MVTLNDYLVEVVYREIWNTQRFVQAMQVGVHDLKDVDNLLQICMLYQEFLIFYLEHNGAEFTEEEVRQVMDHLDDILWTNGNTVVFGN